MEKTCEGPSVLKLCLAVEEVGHTQTVSVSFNYAKRMPTKLFVGGIPYRTTDEELRQLFSQAGEVVSVFIPMDRETQRPRGFAFVEMAEDAAADKAITMFDGSDMGGRKIAVNKARPMEERPRR